MWPELRVKGVNAPGEAAWRADAKLMADDALHVDFSQRGGLNNARAVLTSGGDLIWPDGTTWQRHELVRCRRPQLQPNPPPHSASGAPPKLA